MNKRGSAHLEMIMSFVIFVSFTLFLLFTIETPRKNVIDDSSLLSLKEKFFQNVSTNLTIVLINRTNCKPSDMSNSILVNIVGSSDKKYVYNSSELVDSAEGDCSQGTYKEGYRENREVLSNKSLANIQYLYYNDYETLKQYFGLTKGVDFAILSRGYNMVPNAGIPETNVPAYGYQKQVLYSNGTLVLDTFTIRTW